VSRDAIGERSAVGHRSLTSRVRSTLGAAQQKRKRRNAIKEGNYDQYPKVPQTGKQKDQGGWKIFNERETLMHGSESVEIWEKGRGHPKAKKLVARHKTPFLMIKERGNEGKHWYQ